MSTTHTSHEPSPDDPAHATSDPSRVHPGDIAGETHGPDDHGEAHGHDDHAHDSDGLGPVDIQAWGALLIGISAGLLIVLCMVVAPAVA